MDNRLISIQTQGREAFDMSMQLLFAGAPGGKASHFFDHPKYGFILLWSEDGFLIDGKKVMASKLPFKMNWKSAADLIWEWMEQIPDSKRVDKYEDGDVTNRKAFRAYNEDWGHVAGSHYAFMAVQPCWAWLGK